ncbi:hypothetical protein [Janthinobacterium sp. P210005]|uniref:hypothetical protein n=1 Tax=Janthinobacterium sp. P210005 TaxID=3112938 RepID=UPI002E2751DF|nr:hypothetical protein [Janthinobacterium sp. P210005]
MSTPSTSPDPQLKTPIEYLLSAVPPLKAAFKVLKSPQPLAAIGLENHSWYGMPIALFLIMIFAISILIAGDGAPFVDPFTAIWTYKFELHIFPVRNWTVLILSTMYAVLAWVCSYIAIFLAGTLLNGGISGTNKQALRLAGYAALAIACGYAVVLFVFSALGWILYFFKIRIYIWGWMAIATVILIPFATWGVAKAFRRTSLINNSSILPPLVISTTTILACALGAIFIMETLNEAFMKQGRTVNNLRSTPTAAIVQTCARESTDIVCAVTLFPIKWQDYELIGDWKLGNITNPNATHQARFYWHPAKETDRKFALVTLESRKDVTVEIRTEANRVCKTDNTQVANDDRFFAIKGRVLGIQQNAVQEMRLRIDNAEPSFVDIMKQVCSSQIDA